MERLQKYIARCGVASRRKAEELIKAGKVKVNGKVVTEMGVKVSGNDMVMVNNVPIAKEELKYLVMNKPRYLISSTKDEKGRETVISILPKEYQKYRLYPVGRLDYDTKGVLLLTNDGEFMNLLVGPQSNIEKEYLVRVDGIFKKEDLSKLRSGIDIDGHITRKAKAYIKSVDQKNASSLVGLIIKEGKYHQVKRMFEAIGYPVKRLTRVRFGNIEIGTLKEAHVRELKIHEVKTLVALAQSQK